MKRRLGAIRVLVSPTLCHGSHTWVQALPLRCLVSKGSHGYVCAQLGVKGDRGPHRKRGSRESRKRLVFTPGEGGTAALEKTLHLGLRSVGSGCRDQCHRLGGFNNPNLFSQGLGLEVQDQGAGVVWFW